MKVINAVLCFMILQGCDSSQSSNYSANKHSFKRAKELSQEFLILDTHIDLPHRLNKNWEDVSIRTTIGDFDYVRAREGGLDASFMSIYVSASHQEKGSATAKADSLITLVETLASQWPQRFSIANSPKQVVANFKRGIFSLPLGMENGAPIDGQLSNLRHFYKRGIRYITLTHSKANHICDSSYDSNHKWNGLSPFGRMLVQEMNQIGMMIDISHVSDSTFYQVLRLSKAPVIASHSSCRRFTPGFERNASDDMIKALAANGGVILINFGSDFINDTYRRKMKEAYKHLADKNLAFGSKEAEQYLRQFRAENNVAFATVAEVAAHILHVIKIAGIDHVGFGSDFDGVGDSLPTGLKDVSSYPNLIAELLKADLSEGEIEKICSGNLLRVWSQVESVAAQETTTK